MSFLKTFYLLVNSSLHSKRILLNKSTPEEIAKSKAAVEKQIDVLSDQFDTIEKQVEQLKTQDMSSVVSKAKSFINS